MIHFTRTACIAPGKLGAAIAFAKEVSEYVQGKYQRKLEVSMPVGGNPHRLAWRTSYPSLEALEQFTAATMADPQYLAILHKGGDLFVAGTLNDELWRVL